jgi:TolA-binding protein
MVDRSLNRPAALDEAERCRQVDELEKALDALSAEIAKLSVEDQQRLERELNEAVNGAIRRRVEHLDREAAREAAGQSTSIGAGSGRAPSGRDLAPRRLVERHPDDVP